MAKPKTGEKMPEAPEAEEQEQAEVPNGPIKGERGEYLPATYTTRNGLTREDR